MNHQRVGDGAAPPLVDVDGVVAHIHRHEVLEAHRAAEHLDAVVVGGVHLQVLDDGVAADAAEGDAVQLVAVAHFRAGVFDDHVFHAPGAVLVVVAAVLRLVEAGRAFRVHVAIGGGEVAGGHGAGVVALVGDAEAVDDDAAPLLHVLGPRGAFHVRDRGEGDGRVRRAHGEQLRAAVDDEKVRAGLETPAWRPASTVNVGPSPPRVMPALARLSSVSWVRPTNRLPSKMWAPSFGRSGMRKLTVRLLPASAKDGG